MRRVTHDLSHLSPSRVNERWFCLGLPNGRCFCESSCVRFQVLVEGQPRLVRLAFGGREDLAMVGRWRAPVTLRGNADVRDTLEFARLAAKRWRYYQRSIPTAMSLAEFRAAVRKDAHAEVSLVLVAHGDWFQSSSVLGIAQCRRTWCHHLILEFLAVHPRIAGRLPPKVRGVGSGLLCGLAELARLLGIGLIWGEATARSAPFYAKTLGLRRIQDCFFIRSALLDRCGREFRDGFFGELTDG